MPNYQNTLRELTLSNDNGIKTLETIHPTKRGSKLKLYLFACFIAALAVVGGYYIFIDQPADSEIIALEKPPEPIKRATQEERIQQAEQSSEIKENITAMQSRQKARDSQVQAYLTTTRTPPLHAPDLPEIAPLEAPRNAVNRTESLDQLDVNAGYTLPKPVMEKFTTETGLTKAEIDKAMNQ